MIDLQLWMYRGLKGVIRDQVLKRDGNACTECGSISGLEVHHIIPVRRGGSDMLGNLVTLCNICHKRIEPASSLRYGVKVSDNRTLMHIDRTTHSHLELIAAAENRSKIGELRFLVKDRAKALGVKLK